MTRRNAWLPTLCITVLGSGFAPIVPGTWGSAVAIACFVPLWWFAGRAGRTAVELALVGGILIASWLSVFWGRWAIERFGRKDPRQFVLDEFAGQWVALLVLPLGLSADLWSLAIVAGGQFVLFRIMDILKPPPAAQLEALPAGWGILCDDLFAGIYANVLGQVAWRWLPLASLLGVHLAR